MGSSALQALGAAPLSRFAQPTPGLAPDNRVLVSTNDGGIGLA
jgi:hypothetical protein